MRTGSESEKNAGPCGSSSAVRFVIADDALAACPVAFHCTDVRVPLTLPFKPARTAQLESLDISIFPLDFLQPNLFG